MIEDAEDRDGPFLGSPDGKLPKPKGADDSLSVAIKRSRELIEESQRILVESRKKVPPRR